MNNIQSRTKCVDAVISIGHMFVVIERLTEPRGLALPGGKVDPGETPESAAVREVHEETGLTFVIAGVLGEYKDPGRDPRGHYESMVFYGEAQGQVCAETKKTNVLLLPWNVIQERRTEFISDHYRILTDFVDLRR